MPGTLQGPWPGIRARTGTEQGDRRGSRKRGSGRTGPRAPRVDELVDEPVRMGGHRCRGQRRRRGRVIRLGWAGVRELGEATRATRPQAQGQERIRGVAGKGELPFRWLLAKVDDRGQAAVTRPTLHRSGPPVVGDPSASCGPDRDHSWARAATPGRRGAGRPGHRWRTDQSYGICVAFGSSRSVRSGSCGCVAQFATSETSDIPFMPFHTIGGITTSE